MPLAGAALRLYPSIGLEGRPRLLRRIIESTPWQQEEARLFGRRHPVPRLVAWYGDRGARYRYSGISHDPLPWTPDLAALRRSVEAVCGHGFNSVLLNYYRDGGDAMGLHADDEPELGARPVIASLSLGETRRMFFRHRHDREQPTCSIDLPCGSLLVMRGDTQRNFKHGIRRTARACGPRVNLTFRQIVG